MIKLSTWLLGFPLAIVIIVFAISNRTSVDFELWPFPYTVNMPVYVAVLGVSVPAFIFGGFISWVSGGKVRKENRKRAKRIKELEKQIAQIKKDTEKEQEQEIPEVLL